MKVQMINILQFYNNNINLQMINEGRCRRMSTEVQIRLLKLGTTLLKIIKARAIVV